ncbi:UNVERIFIED_CONTAM: hypothetical protein RMT77_000987 [Armadillidium vulgare]
MKLFNERNSVLINLSRMAPLGTRNSPSLKIGWSSQQDFFLWSMLKGEVDHNMYRTPVLYATVTPTMLMATFRNMEKCMHACLDANGDHFKHLLRC